MNGFQQELHPIYGAIPCDGEYVERGEVLGLTVDMEVVTAPVSGWVRLESTGSHAQRQLRIEILPNRMERDQRTMPPAA